MKFQAHKSLYLAILAALLIGGSGAVGSGARRVAGHVPRAQMARARHVGRHAAASKVQLAVSLNLHDPEGLQDLLHGLYDPADSRYHQFLSPSEFKQRFSPSDAEVATVVDSLRARGLAIAKVHENNLLVEVEGTSAAVEQAFQVELHDYQTTDGRVAFAPSTEPLLQGEGADHVMAVNGLSNLVRRRTHTFKAQAINPNAGSIADYMTPSKIRTAYNTSSIASTGSGETLALMELDGYAGSDISAYASYFSISPVPTLQNVLVSSAGTTPTGAAGADTTEVCLDIEVAMAIAPGLTKIMVYEGVNTDAGVLATYSKIANDNIAKTVSSSWGYYENGNVAATLNSENTIFQQMATQGQSMFAAAGDSGAYDDGSTLSVDDPASQPYVTGVGGTTLTSNATTGVYSSESSWNSGTEGGGGGISAKWATPTWQSGLGTVSNLGSGTTQRMVPDVSLDANPNTGYPIYVSGAWSLVGGTSAAAPLWAAFAAIVNQGRVANGLARAGFMNPTLYQYGAGATASSLFHDIADNSTNRHYPAVAGYDMATGLGTINGANLYNAFIAPDVPTSVASAASAMALTVSWAAATGATSYKVYRASAASGPYTAIASGVAAVSYADTTSVGLNYYYVTAVAGSNESAGSLVVSGAINQAVPAAPTGLTGTLK